MLKYHNFDSLNIYFSIFMLIIPNKQEIIKPNNNSTLNDLNKVKFLIISKILAPKITGIANKKVNLKAVCGFKFRDNDAYRVVPDLDIPGNTAIPCKVPMIVASRIVISSKSLLFFCCCWMFLFDINNIIDVIINPIPIICRLIVLIIFSKQNPMIAVGIQAITIIQIRCHFFWVKILLISCHNTIIIDNTVPKCKKVSTSKLFALKLIKCWIIAKCPELEIGKNSVKPWTAPNNIICQ